MSTFDDPYRVLGINRSASEDEVKKAYRKAALQHHPDKCAPEDKEQAEIRFRAISEAYEILKDPTMRQRYDTFGMDGIKNGGARRSEGSPFGPSFGGFSGTAGQHPFFHDPRSIFEEFFGGRDPFSDSFFNDPFSSDPFGNRRSSNNNSSRSSQSQQSGPFNHPFFSPFPSMMQSQFGNSSGGGGSFTSFQSSSSSFGGFGGGSGGSFRSQSSQTQIINGERTTKTTITDEKGTRVETVVIGRDGKEKKREVIENDKVVLSVEGGNAGNSSMMLEDGSSSSERRSRY